MRSMSGNNVPHVHMTTANTNREREREERDRECGGQNKLNTLLWGVVWGVITTLAFFCGGLNDDTALLAGCREHGQQQQ